MSKYKVRYFSESKKQYLNIEDMHTAHLENAYKKGMAAAEALLVVGPAEDVSQLRGSGVLLDAMATELSARGATVEGLVVTWPERDEEPDRSMDAGVPGEDRRVDNPAEREDADRGKHWRL